MTREAAKEEVIQRWRELPGIAWVRAASLLVWRDTPGRIPSQAALWKYLGIGLERRHSGTGPAAAAAGGGPSGMGSRVLA